MHGTVLIPLPPIPAAIIIIIIGTLCNELSHIVDEGLKP